VGFIFNIDFHSPGPGEALAVKRILMSRDWDPGLCPSAILTWRLSVPCVLYKDQNLLLNWYFYSVAIILKKTTTKNQSGLRGGGREN